MENQTNFPYHFNSNTCKTCGGKCCRGPTGYVWVSREELEKMAVTRQMDMALFFKHYVRQVQDRLALQERVINGEHLCCFFDQYECLCTMYESRPLQCRTFPFWDRFKYDSKKLFDLCPGVSSK